MLSTFSAPLGPRMAGIAVSLLLSIVVAAAPAAQGQARKVAPLVAPAALEPLLPTIEGWTKVRSTSNLVADGCAYAFAEAVYRAGDRQLRVMVADTGYDADALMTVATIVLSFPAGHTEKVPPDTVINRITYRDYPTATMSSNADGQTEFTVVVGDRFVVKVEGKRAGDADALRTVVDKIDLNKVAELGR